MDLLKAKEKGPLQQPQPDDRVELIWTSSKFSINRFVHWHLDSWTWIFNNYFQIQVFLDFRGFDFSNFRFNAGLSYFPPLKSILLSNLDLRGFRFLRFLCVPHINSVNQGMPLWIFLHSYTTALWLAEFSHFDYFLIALNTFFSIFIILP